MINEIINTHTLHKLSTKICKQISQTCSSEFSGYESGYNDVDKKLIKKKIYEYLISTYGEYINQSPHKLKKVISKLDIESTNIQRIIYK